jgi:vacuolar-type H+-ATPase subunit E/Vma4
LDTPGPNSAETLCEEILAEARRQSEEILCRARQEVADLHARAATEADTMRRTRLDQARAEGRRRSELILATVPVEASRLQAARVEALLNTVREELHRRLTAGDGFDYRDTIITLAARAVNQMNGEGFIVRLSKTDFSRFGGGLAQEISGRAGRSSLRLALSDDSTITDRGVVVQDDDGCQVWDNRFGPRLERLWPELRRQIAIRAGLVVTAGGMGGVK